MSQLPAKYPVYSKEYYDEVFEEIIKLPNNTSVDNINSFIKNKLGIIIYQYLEHTGIGIEQFPIYRVRSVSKNELLIETESSEFHYPQLNSVLLEDATEKAFKCFILQVISILHLLNLRNEFI